MTVERPTIWSVRAHRYLEDADECLRMMLFYARVNDLRSVKHWSEVWLQKIHDAKNIRVINHGLDKRLR